MCWLFKATVSISFFMSFACYLVIHRTFSAINLIVVSAINIIVVFAKNKTVECFKASLQVAVVVVCHFFGSGGDDKNDEDICVRTLNLCNLFVSAKVYFLDA
jgi:intracellular septation protein A